MKESSSFAHRHLAALLLVSLVGIASMAPTSLTNARFPVHFQKEPLSLPVATTFDSQAADLNGDGNLDLAVLSDSALYILLGDGNGTFSQPLQYNQGGFQTVLALGDFNGDGYPDAAVANFPGINVLLNDGAGGFPTSLFINTGEEPSGLAVADFNKDGKLDLAVSDFQSNSISILLGNGAGGFAAPVVVPTGTSPVHIVARDFDGDGVPDLAVAEYGSMDLRIFKGIGNGQFSAGAVYPLGGNANCLVKADFNHDGKVDLAVGVFNIYPNDHVAVFLGDGNGGFAQSASIPVAVYLGLAAADIDGNRRKDLIFLDNASPRETVDVALGNGDGSFRPVHRTSLPRARERANYTVSTGDFNSDGRIDIFTAIETGVLLFNMP